MRGPGLEGQQQRSERKRQHKSAATEHEAERSQGPRPGHALQQLESSLLMLDFLGEMPQEQAAQPAAPDSP
jgi:hypothetical protein